MLLSASRTPLKRLFQIHSRLYSDISPINHLNSLLKQSLHSISPNVSSSEAEQMCKVYKKGDQYQSALPFNRNIMKGSDPISVANELIRYI